MHANFHSATRGAARRGSPATVSRLLAGRFYLVSVVLSTFFLPLGGCVSDAEKINAIKAVNEDFRQEYEPIITAQGTRLFNASQAQAFVAMEACLRKLGMTVEAQDSKVGYIRAAAPAPAPLTHEEWQRVGETDLPRMRRIVKEHVGPMGGFIKFEPQGLDIVLNVTTLETSSRQVEVSVTMRMRETAPPKTGYPRREYPPPTAVRMGIAKFWSQFDRELSRIQANR